MSHYHMEVVMPPTDDIRAAITKLLESYYEGGDNEENSYKAFWDFWVIGGRWSGAKMEATIGSAKIAAFRQQLVEAKVTVSGFRAGKQGLNPESQIPLVDGMWSEAFPQFAGPCPLFNHYNDQYDREKRIIPVDVCTVDEIPEALECSTLFIAHPDGDEAETLLFTSIWNGVTHQETKFSGSVKAGIRDHNKRLKHMAPAFADKARVKGDWLVVTVDYHS